MKVKKIAQGRERRRDRQREAMERQIPHTEFLLKSPTITEKRKVHLENRLVAEKARLLELARY